MSIKAYPAKMISRGNGGGGDSPITANRGGGGRLKKSAFLKDALEKAEQDWSKISDETITDKDVHYENEEVCVRETGPDIREALNDLTDSINGLNEVTGILLERLDPLVEVQPKDTTEPNKSFGKCQLSIAIREASYKIRLLQDTVISTTRGLQI